MLTLENKTERIKRGKYEIKTSSFVKFRKMEESCYRKLNKDMHEKI